jgi:hypothetical protein
MTRSEGGWKKSIEVLQLNLISGFADGYAACTSCCGAGQQLPTRSTEGPLEHGLLGRTQASSLQGDAEDWIF